MSPAGRPEVGKPINVRLGDDLLAQVDEYAATNGIPRAEAVRLLVARSLRRSRRRATVAARQQLTDFLKAKAGQAREVITFAQRDAAGLASTLNRVGQQFQTADPS